MLPMIEVKNLVHCFGEHRALADVSFTVNSGEVVGLLGPNGAGKTTTVRLLNGLYTPTSGTLSVLGLNPVSQGAEVRARTGVLTETPALYERLTARQNLEFFGKLAEMPDSERRRRISELLDFFELATRADDRAETFSKGMKQRLALARALLQEPSLLFLDEPTSGLDPEAALQVHELIRDIHHQRGKTVILCSHNLVEAERLCSRLLIMNHGRILSQGTLDELRRIHAPGLWVQVEFFTPLEPVVEESLSSIQGVLQVTRQSPVLLRLRVEEEAVIPVAASHLVQHGASLLSLQPARVSLEEIYFQLQNEERNGAK